MFEKLEASKSPSYLLSPTKVPYILCNEQNQQETLPQLAPSSFKEKSSNDLHLGFSVWFNLDIICTAKPNYAVILDFDANVYEYIYPLLYLTILNSLSREQFKSQFLEKISEEELFHPFVPYLDIELNDLMKNSYGFLANEENFIYLKSMVAEGRIFFGKADITLPSTMSDFKSWIDEKQLKLNTLYLSNIPEWIIQQDRELWQSTAKNITALIQPFTYLLDAFYPTTQKNGSGPPQRITQGTLPDYKVMPAEGKNCRRIPFSRTNPENEPRSKKSGINSSVPKMLFFDAPTIGEKPKSEMSSSNKFY